MKLDNIEALLQKYYEGETTLTEDAQLKELFSQTDCLPDELKRHAASFQFYALHQKQQLDKELTDEWLFEKVEREAISTRNRFAIPFQQVTAYWRVAASIILLAGGFWAGSQFRQGASTVQSTEVVALRQEVREMKAVLQASSSASERISVVSQKFSSDPNDELIKVLIRTMNTDANVNVRLAASEALYRFNDHPAVREAFIQSLNIQKDPLVQITLIEMLVTLNEKSAVTQLEEMSKQKNLLPIVKSKAQEGIGILM